MDSPILHGRHYHLDPQVDPKIAKRHFFKDIQNSFQWATGIGLETHQKKFPKKISTNTVARAVQNFDQFFGEVLDLYQLPIERNFEYLEKNGVLQFLDQLAGPDDNAFHALVHFCV